MNLCMITPPETTCCFTGHREISREAIGAGLVDKLDAAVAALYDDGMRTFRCGGALGFDTLSAISIIRFRASHPDARLVLVLPCRDQDAGWSERARERYGRILNAADEVVYIGNEYKKGIMLERDRCLVDGCSACVAYLRGDKSRSGTGYTVKYAKRSGLRMIYIE